MVLKASLHIEKLIIKNKLLRGTYILQLNLIKQYCARTEIKNCLYYSIAKGIPKGCPSAQIAALYLKPLDDALKNHGVYVRFMDDWGIMVCTKEQLRKVVRVNPSGTQAIKVRHAS